MEKNKISDIAKRIVEEPFQWVLILGDVVSECTTAEKRRAIYRLAKEHSDKFLDRADFFKRIVRQDYNSIAEILFGTVWDEVALLDSVRECQINLRKEYANIFRKKENANIYASDLGLGKIPEAFPGIVMTICQDELLEAFWENRRSMSVSERTWTPSDFLNPTMWNRWINFQNELELLSADLFMAKDSEARLLVKLYGDCANPSQLLISPQDFELYYPESDINTYAKMFLKEIFAKKNIIFWGADTAFLEEKRVPFAPGISRLLEETPTGRRERYIFIGEEASCEWKKYHMDKIPLSKGRDDEMYQLLDEIIRIQKSKRNKRVSNAEAKEETAKDLIMEQNAARDLFKKLYIRRPVHCISDHEWHIIDRLISASKGGWNQRNIYLLSMIANNQADFYDLRKTLHAAKEREVQEEGMTEERYIEKVLRDILEGRMGAKSEKLFRLLAAYGSGFPLGFFQLLSENEKELKEWKRAGFQLTNSGIYIQRKYRKYLHKRMEYADLIMKTAGQKFDVARIEKAIEELEHQLDDSYFYPLDEKYFPVTEDENAKNETNGIFVKMLLNLRDILEDKREGYNHIRSLLETEIYNVIKLIRRLDDRELDCKSQLIYYLLRESKVAPVEDEEAGKLEEDLDKMIAKLQENKDNTHEEEPLNYSYIVMAYLAQGILLSKSCEKVNLEAAIEKCEQAKFFFDKYERVFLHPNRLLSRNLFNQKLEIYFLMSKIYGRISSVEEIKRCAVKNGRRSEQEKALRNMEEALKKINDLLENRKKGTGNHYAESYAEYYNHFGEYKFKMSQFYMENFRDDSNDGKDQAGWKRKAMESYKEADEYYRKASNYYEKYPDQYVIQRADVMRNLADSCYRNSNDTDNDKEKKALRAKCYYLLTESYVLYRKDADLHGIADVLQSMGHAEDYSQTDMSKDRRSSLNFYDMAMNLYRQLGDEWSYHVASTFKDGALDEIEKNRAN